MEYEKEITVEVLMNYDELYDLLMKNNFEIKEKFSIYDIYYSQFFVDRNTNYLDILKDCILIREIIEDNKNTKMITYKHKEFDEKGNIMKQGKVKCNIEKVESGCNLFEALNYNKIIELKDDSIVFTNGMDEVVVQKVNDKHLYIEVEEKCRYTDRVYKSIDEMKNIFTTYHIPIKDNNYFVKKAEIEMKEVYGDCN